MEIKRFTKNWESRVRDYCDACYSQIVVSPGELNDYNRCHNVATQYAMNNDDEKLAAVVYRHENEYDYCVHFINFHDGEFVDNAIGWRSKYYVYRFIRWVNRAEMTVTPSILADLQNKFYSMATVPERIFGRIEI